MRTNFRQWRPQRGAPENHGALLPAVAIDAARELAEMYSPQSGVAFVVLHDLATQAAIEARRKWNPERLGLPVDLEGLERFLRGRMEKAVREFCGIEDQAKLRGKRRRVAVS